MVLHGGGVRMCGRGVCVWRYSRVSVCTERSTHTCARVPADLALATGGGGRLGEVRGRVSLGLQVLHRET